MNKCKINTIIQQYKTSLSRGQRDPSIMQILLCLLYSLQGQQFSSNIQEIFVESSIRTTNEIYPVIFPKYLQPLRPVKDILEDCGTRTAESSR